MNVIGNMVVLLKLALQKFGLRIFESFLPALFEHINDLFACPSSIVVRLWLHQLFRLLQKLRRFIIRKVVS